MKEGYKQTEVGVIPEDWEVDRLGNCLFARPDYGINAAAVNYSDDLPVYIRITDITDDGYFSPEKLVSVKHRDSSMYKLEPNDFLFARTGASTGKTYLYNPDDGELIFAGFLIRARVNPKKLIPDFLANYTKTTP
jgi:type I restriction enzyme, S subunit